MAAKSLQPKLEDVSKEEMVDVLESFLKRKAVVEGLSSHDYSRLERLRDNLTYASNKQSMNSTFCKSTKGSKH